MKKTINLAGQLGWRDAMLAAGRSKDWSLSARAQDDMRSRSISAADAVAALRAPKVVQWSEDQEAAIFTGNGVAVVTSPATKTVLAVHASDDNPVSASDIVATGNLLGIPVTGDWVQRTVTEICRIGDVSRMRIARNRARQRLLAELFRSGSMSNAKAECLRWATTGATA